MNRNREFLLKRGWTLQYEKKMGCFRIVRWYKNGVSVPQGQALCIEKQTRRK